MTYDRRKMFQGSGVDVYLGESSLSEISSVTELMTWNDGSESESHRWRLSQGAHSITPTPIAGISAPNSCAEWVTHYPLRLALRRSSSSGSHHMVGKAFTPPFHLQDSGTRGRLKVLNMNTAIQHYAITLHLKGGKKLFLVTKTSCKCVCMCDFT